MEIRFVHSIRDNVSLLGGYMYNVNHSVNSSHGMYNSSGYVNVPG